MHSETCAVPKCDRPRRKMEWCQAHYQRQRRFGDPLGGGPMRVKFASHEERFWAKVDRSGGPDACWPWTGSRVPKGYGKFNWTAVSSSPLIAPRVAMFFTNGEWPRNAMHRCDNPPCCNPSHLSDGTHAQNMADAMIKGRVPGHVLRETDREQLVCELYEQGFSQTQIARQFGVHQSTISRIVNHVPAR